MAGIPPGNVFTLKIKEIRLGRKPHLTYYRGKKAAVEAAAKYQTWIDEWFDMKRLLFSLNRFLTLKTIGLKVVQLPTEGAMRVPSFSVIPYNKNCLFGKSPEARTIIYASIPISRIIA